MQLFLERVGKIGFVTLFVAILIGPSVDQLIGLQVNETNKEKRTLKELPDFTWQRGYASAFEAYYNDHFGFRSTLTDWGALYKVRLLKASPKPDQVVFGQNGFLFYVSKKGNQFDSYTHRNRLTDHDLSQLVKRWEIRTDINVKNGAEYIVGFWPAKTTIYPEYVPRRLAMQKVGAQSKVDQIIQYLAESGSRLKLVDVRPALFAAKNDLPGELYHRLDTHWNDYGAFVAYSKFLSDCFSRRGIVPKSLDDFEILWRTTHSGDLVDIMGITSDGVLSDHAPVFKNRESHPFRVTKAEGFPPRTIITKNDHCDNQLRLLVFRDSYFTALVKYFSLHFSEVVYIWKGYEQSMVDRVQPDIIIDAPAERFR